MDQCKNCARSKHRTEDEKKYFRKRLNTIDGQVKGIVKMIDEDKYCKDILIQLLAINKSIKSISIELLKSHLSTCIVNDIQKGDTLVIDEVMDLIRRLD